jgi:hypothetical protein
MLNHYSSPLQIIDNQNPSGRTCSTAPIKLASTQYAEKAYIVDTYDQCEQCPQQRRNPQHIAAYQSALLLADGCPLAPQKK